MASTLVKTFGSATGRCPCRQPSIVYSRFLPCAVWVTHSTHTYHYHEGLWEALSATLDPPSSLLTAALSSVTPGEREHLCRDAIHWLWIRHSTLSSHNIWVWRWDSYASTPLSATNTDTMSMSFLDHTVWASLLGSDFLSLKWLLFRIPPPCSYQG